MVERVNTISDKVEEKLANLSGITLGDILIM